MCFTPNLCTASLVWISQTERKMQHRHLGDPQQKQALLQIKLFGPLTAHWKFRWLIKSALIFFCVCVFTIRIYFTSLLSNKRADYTTFISDKLSFMRLIRPPSSAFPLWGKVDTFLPELITISWFPLPSLLIPSALYSSLVNVPAVIVFAEKVCRERRRSQSSYVCCYLWQSVFVSGGHTWESFRVAIFPFLVVWRFGGTVHQQVGRGGAV